MNKAQRKALQVPIDKLVAAVGDIEQFLHGYGPDIRAPAPVTREKRMLRNAIIDARDAIDGAINTIHTLVEEYGGEVR